MTEVNASYLKEARELIDLLHDKRFLADDCSRESMRWLEDFIGFLFQSRVDMAIKCHDLTKSLRGR